MIRFLTALFVLVSYFGARAETEIRIRSEVTIEGNQPVRYGDLIDSRGLSVDEAIKNLVAFEVFEGEQEAFSSSEVSQALSRNGDLKKVLANSSLHIPQTVLVKKNKTTTIPTAAQIEKQIREAILKNCEDCEVTVQNLTIPKIQSRRLTEVKIQYGSTNLIGSFTLPLRFSEEGKVKTVWITGQTILKMKARVAKRFVNQGDKIGAEDFRTEYVDMTFARDAIATEKAILGATASRSIANGKAILASDLKKEPAVQRGQVITVMAGNNDFQITSQGISEQNGFLGDVIRFKNLEGQKVLSGTVIERGIVRIE
ncbi:MAG: flagellar basal body P-ring formation chaperone FlgA [Pseudobdellovibrionaceae bacterium]